MYKIFGWINIAAVFILLLPFAINSISKKKDSILSKISSFLKKLHKPLGIIMVVSVAVHGISALGSLTIHTGTIAGLLYVLAGLAGILFVWLKKKALFKSHKALAVAFVLLIVLHLLVPSLF